MEYDNTTIPTVGLPQNANITALISKNIDFKEKRLLAMSFY